MDKLIGEIDGQVIFASMDNNKIKRLSSYYIEYPENTYDGNMYLTESSCGGDWTLNNITYKTGMELAEDFEPFFRDIDGDIKEAVINEKYYHAYGSWCSECGTFHDTEQYYDLSFVITEDCEVLCKSCANAEDLLIEVNDTQDLFRSKDITGMDFATDDFEEVETLFCDSSGFGSSSEPALTESEAKDAVNRLLEDHGTLYGGLTGIGQFQVYVTLYKRRAVQKTA